MTEKILCDLSSDSIEAFNLIEMASREQLSRGILNAGDSFAVLNTLTNINAVKNYNEISESTRNDYSLLSKEPAICRVTVSDDVGSESVFYIARKSTVSLQGKINLASYKSDIGRLASTPVGDEVVICVGGEEKTFYILEKARYKPIKNNESWDSLNTIFEHVDFDLQTIKSLLAILNESGVADPEAELAAILSGAKTTNIYAGLRHEVRSAMELRDQPILDKFQDEIFRLPLNKQLIILGPPGTGKTTTLILRLGQKINREFLTESELRYVETSVSSHLAHEKNWLMFTPTELLKHFVKEAFNRAQVPASDSLIRTWESHRSDIARRVLGILQSSSTNGKFIYKHNLNIVNDGDGGWLIEWFGCLEGFHERRIIDQLISGVALIEGLKNSTNYSYIDPIVLCMRNAESKKLSEIYDSLDPLEREISLFVALLKNESDKLIHLCLVGLFKNDKRFLTDLAKFIETINQDDDSDSDDDFDDDKEDDTLLQITPEQKAEKFFKQVIRVTSRYKFLKRSLPKDSRAQKFCAWLGDRIPENSTLVIIGESIALQNGLRRFINCSKRYVLDVSSSYREFRKISLKDKKWFLSRPENQRYIGPTELDAVVLLMLKNARQLLSQSFIYKNLNEPKFSNLKIIADQFRTQILVDEATDFSPLQLACMSALTDIKSKSFFACGDFNQRITPWGVRSEKELLWAINGIEVKSIKTVYRQSKRLNEFALKIKNLFDGDVGASGDLPKEMSHTGVLPALLENCTSIDDAAFWVVEKIQEIERIIDDGRIPTIAVLVNNESEVFLLTESLNILLEDINVRAVACADGKSLGEGQDVRVFDVRYIKGLEFEAVFFINLNELIENQPLLFNKYLYVGATRAATYFGATCPGDLPDVLKPVKECFTDGWV